MSQAAGGTRSRTGMAAAGRTPMQLVQNMPCAVGSSPNAGACPKDQKAAAASRSSFATSPRIAADEADVADNARS